MSQEQSAAYEIYSYHTRAKVPEYGVFISKKDGNSTYTIGKFERLKPYKCLDVVPKDHFVEEERIIDGQKKKVYEGGKSLNNGHRREGFHSFAFGAYDLSLFFLLDGCTAIEAKQKLDKHFHLDFKTAFILDAMVAHPEDLMRDRSQKKDSLRRYDKKSSDVFYGPDLNHIFSQFSDANNLHREIHGKELSEKDLVKKINMYLNHVLFLYQYCHSANFYDGVAGSLSEATQIKKCLNDLKENRKRDSLEGFVSQIRELFDQSAISALLSGEPTDVFVLSFFEIQIYRLILSYFNGSYAQHLDAKFNKFVHKKTHEDHGTWREDEDRFPYSSDLRQWIIDTMQSVIGPSHKSGWIGKSLELIDEARNYFIYRDVNTPHEAFSFCENFRRKMKNCL